MSNRLFQGIIHQMSEAIDRTIGVIDESSIIIAWAISLRRPPLMLWPLRMCS